MSTSHKTDLGKTTITTIKKSSKIQVREFQDTEVTELGGVKRINRIEIVLPNELILHLAKDIKDSLS